MASIMRKLMTNIRFKTKRNKNTLSSTSTKSKTNNVVRKNSVIQNPTKHHLCLLSTSIIRLRIQPNQDKTLNQNKKINIFLIQTIKTTK